MKRKTYTTGLVCVCFVALTACSASRSPSSSPVEPDDGPPAQIVRTEPPEYRHIPQGAWTSATKSKAPQQRSPRSTDGSSNTVVYLEPLTVTEAAPNRVEENESEEPENDGD